VLAARMTKCMLADRSPRLEFTTARKRAVAAVLPAARRRPPIVFDHHQPSSAILHRHGWPHVYRFTRTRHGRYTIQSEVHEHGYDLGPGKAQAGALLHAPSLKGRAMKPRERNLERTRAEEMTINSLGEFRSSDHRR
jgi:hypothetical protein